MDISSRIGHGAAIGDRLSIEKDDGAHRSFVLTRLDVGRKALPPGGRLSISASILPAWRKGLPPYWTNREGRNQRRCPIEKESTRVLQPTQA